MIDLHHSKEIYRLKLGCTSANVADVCLHMSNIARFNPFTESDKHLSHEKQEHKVRGPSIVFTTKADVGNNHRDSKNWCKIFVAINASQL